jgi:hypothetical protein
MLHAEPGGGTAAPAATRPQGGRRPGRHRGAPPPRRPQTPAAELPGRPSAATQLKKRDIPLRPGRARTTSARAGAAGAPAAALELRVLPSAHNSRYA